MDETILKLKMLWLYGGAFREWHTDVWRREGRERMCCDGYHCGCQGADYASWWEYLWNDRKGRP